MNVIVNKDMSDFWNGDGGINWMRFQSRLETSLAPFGLQALTIANISSGERVMDVGCGWGDSTYEIAKRVKVDGYVQGVDISELILKQAKNRLNSLAVENISFECLDAESHDFNPLSVDVVYSRFGVMFFSNPVNAFSNIRKILKPDGRLAFICWQSVDNNLWVKLPLDIVTSYVDVNPSNPDSPGGFSFGDANKVLNIINKAGFVNAVIEPYHSKLVIGADVNEAVVFLSHLGPASAVIEDPELNIKTKNKILFELRETLAQYVTPEGIKLDAATWIVTANNPISFS